MRSQLLLNQVGFNFKQRKSDYSTFGSRRWARGTLNVFGNVMRLVSDIWHSILGTEVVMPEDDSFVLAGDSLLGINGY